MSDHISALLARASAGDEAAQKEFFQLVSDELHQVAHNRMRNERSEHTLQTTALVNEVYLKMVGRNPAAFGSRFRFFAAASQAMRHILIDHARKRSAQKAKANGQRVPLDDTIDWLEQEQHVSLLDLDPALDRLDELHARAGEVVRRRFFGGQPMTAIAEDLEVSLSTVEKDWKFARAFLKKELT